jgi:two-component system sensor histidine kinase/response regulator
MSAPRILIVDDDTALLEALPEALRLRMQPIAIDTCDTAQAALERVAATDYDAIVSDIKMPGMDGLTLLKSIHELRPETPTLLITGHGEHDLAIQALRHGAYDFIQKPIERDYFVTSLRRAIQVRQLKREVEAQRIALEQHAASLERVVEERTRELREASQAKDTFLSIASHELKTPLTTIKALAQLTQRRLEQAGSPEAGYLVRMERAIRRMELLVNDLVDVSRIEGGKLTLRMERADLAALVRQVAHEQVTLSERTIIVDVPDGAIEAEMDAERVWQVLTNLLTNALKYSPKERPVAITLSRDGAEAAICVRDEGDGIAPHELDHVFERFYRGEDARIWSGSGVGLGLGLYISHELVERHGGRIWAESTVGQGSAFYVALPCYVQSFESAPTMQTTPGPSHAESEAHV